MCPFAQPQPQTSGVKVEVSRAPYVPAGLKPHGVFLRPFSAAASVHPLLVQCSMFLSPKLTIEPPSLPPSHPPPHLARYRRMNCERRRRSSLSFARKRCGLRREPAPADNGSENWISSEQRREHGVWRLGEGGGGGIDRTTVCGMEERQRVVRSRTHFVSFSK